jgi:hypothetical protein
MANIQRIPEMIHGRRSKCQLVHGACNCWRTRRNGERRPLLEKTQTFWNRNNNQKWRIEFSKLTRTGPLGPALRTVAPNHWSDFWSICCPDALLFPVFILFQISNWINSPLIYAMILVCLYLWRRMESIDTGRGFLCCNGKRIHLGWRPAVPSALSELQPTTCKEKWINI